MKSADRSPMSSSPESGTIAVSRLAELALNAMGVGDDDPIAASLAALETDVRTLQLALDAEVDEYTFEEMIRSGVDRFLHRVRLIRELHNPENAEPAT